ncbi:uncharacterized protein LOC142597815 [Dermatophagoides farinae]|uniref:uncharacterized protein LOC142597815 n=1 Tax=Dermatophagoides farinae TaxID=6954 RepID=UPI003F5EABA2
MKFFIVIFLCIATRIVDRQQQQQRFVYGLPTGKLTTSTTATRNSDNDYDDMGLEEEEDPENYLWNMSTSTGDGIQPSFTDDELQEILNSMHLPTTMTTNVSTFDYSGGGGGDGGGGIPSDMISNPMNHSQQGFVIVWRNPYPFSNDSNDSELLGRNGDDDRDDEDDDHPLPHPKPHPKPHPPKYDFDEMEQRDFLRTVIFLANQQIRIKFHLCEIRRFRSHYVRRWNLYRCSSRFTVARLGKPCDPDKTYDGYVNFIVQNPELPPLLAIRYYVFQFLYESSMALVNKMNDNHLSLSSSSIPWNQLQQSNDQIMIHHQNQQLSSSDIHPL